MPVPRALVPLLLAALGGVGAAACKRGEAAAPDARTDAAHSDVELTEAALKAARLAYAEVTRAPRTAAVSVLGRLDFAQARVARVGPLFEGRVAALAVKPGDRVKKGAALATLDSLDVGRSRADYVSAVARRERADVELAREKTLMEQQLTTQKRLVEAETERRLADLDVRAAEERLRAVGVAPGGGVRAEGGLRPTTSLVLTAPLDGEVMEVAARVGQAVRREDTLFVVGDVDELWLMVEIYERDLRRVHPGDKVTITTIARPGQVFEGTVEHVQHQVDPARRVVDARIRLPNPGHALFPGMSAAARILGGPAAEDAGGAGAMLAVPRAAVQLIDGQPFVFVEEGHGRFELRALETGVEEGGLVEVLRGVREGERVATEGSFLLKAEVLREQMGKND